MKKFTWLEVALMVGMVILAFTSLTMSGAHRHTKRQLETARRGAQECTYILDACIDLLPMEENDE